ncbi:MAG: ATP-binding protein [bacterium]|nr:ATP-binding protein [bacterium]
MKKIRMIMGLLRFHFHMLRPAVMKEISGIIRELAIEAQDKVHHKTFILLVGFTHSGKTTLRRENENLNKLFCLETILIHDALNSVFRFLQDDNTITGHAYWERQFWTNYIRTKVLELVLKQGIAVVSDSCNLQYKDRKEKLAIANNLGYNTIILNVECPEPELLSRLLEADYRKQLNDEEPAWVRLYEDVQKNRYESPQRSEAGFIWKIDGTEDPKHIQLSFLGKALNNH